MKTTAASALVLISLLPTAPGQGTILWNEAVNGPLANDPGFATPVGTMQPGTNSLLGAAQFVPTGGGPGGTLLSDFITYSIGVGYQIDAVQLVTDAPVLVWIGNSSFTSEFASVVSPANGALLPQLGLGFIASGTYGFYISDRQFGSTPSIANYRLDFVVQAVPEPASLWLLVGGLGFLGIQRRKKRV